MHIVKYTHTKILFACVHALVCDYMSMSRCNSSKEINFINEGVLNDTIILTLHDLQCPTNHTHSCY